MSRIATSSADVRMRNARRQYVPIITTIAACLLSLLPIVVSSPLIPDIAFARREYVSKPEGRDFFYLTRKSL